MASKRRIRRKECERKRRYWTKESAQKDLDILYRKKHERFHLYQCKFCGGWHVGHKYAGVK